MPQSNSQAEYVHNINKIVDVDEASLSITVEIEDSAHPRTFTLRHPDLDLPQPIWLQMFRTCVDKIPLSGGTGGWPSWRSLEQGMATAGDVAATIVAQGVTDLTSKAFTRAVAEQALKGKNPQARPILSRAVLLTDRTGRERLATNIDNIPMQHAASSGDTPIYTEDEAEALRAAASKVVRHFADEHKAMLKGLGFETSGKHVRAWQQLTATDLIDAARKRDSERVKNGATSVTSRARPRQAASTPSERGWDAWLDDEIIDYLILDPEKALPGTWFRLPRLRRLAGVVYPGLDELLAFSILHCLHLGGPNRSTIQGLGADDIVHTGAKHAVLRVGKARNHTKTNLAAKFYSLDGSLEGLLGLLHARTEPSRHHRATQLGAGHHMADKYYCLTRRSSEDTSVTILRTRWPETPLLFEAVEEACTEAGIDVPSISYRGLREVALRHNLTKDPFGGVVLQSRTMRDEYLQRVMPDVLLANQVNESQQAMVQAGEQALFTALENGTAVDMEYNVCVSDRRTPDGDQSIPDRDWCNYSLSMCFTCPNGYRTQDSIPGLLAVVEYCDEQLRHGIVTDRELHVLRERAQDALGRYPPVQVDKARSETSAARIDDMKKTIHAMHTDPRSADGR